MGKSLVIVGADFSANSIGISKAYSGKLDLGEKIDTGLKLWNEVTNLKYIIDAKFTEISGYEGAPAYNLLTNTEVNINYNKIAINKNAGLAQNFVAVGSEFIQLTKGGDGYYHAVIERNGSQFTLTDKVANTTKTVTASTLYASENEDTYNMTIGATPDGDRYAACDDYEIVIYLPNI